MRCTALALYVRAPWRPLGLPFLVSSTKRTKLRIEITPISTLHLLGVFEVNSYPSDCVVWCFASAHDPDADHLLVFYFLLITQIVCSLYHAVRAWIFPILICPSETPLMNAPINGRLHRLASLSTHNDTAHLTCACCVRHLAPPTNPQFLTAWPENHPRAYEIRG
jgi:hypothetical protein